MGQFLNSVVVGTTAYLRFAGICFCSGITRR